MSVVCKSPAEVFRLLHEIKERANAIETFLCSMESSGEFPQYIKPVIKKKKKVVCEPQNKPKSNVPRARVIYNAVETSRRRH